MSKLVKIFQHFIFNKKVAGDGSTNFRQLLSFVFPRQSRVNLGVYSGDMRGKLEDALKSFMNGNKFLYMTYAPAA